MIAGSAADIIITRVGWRQVALLLTATCVLFADGFDAQVVSFVAPALEAEWHLTHADLGHVFAANLFGLMIGAMAVAPLADMLSRRLVSIGCVAAFGLLTLCVTLVHGPGALTVLRFVTGLALGGAMPSMIVAVSEFLPPRVRARLLAVLVCGFSFGFAGAGFAASLLLKPYGWQILFRIGGTIPLLLLPALWVFLPESPAYLATRGRLCDLQALLQRMGGSYAPPQPAAARVGFPLAALFQGGLAPVTLAVWLAYFCSGTTLYFLGNWLPVLLHGAGFGVQQASRITSAYLFGGLLGGIVVGVLVDWFGAVALGGVILMASIAVVAAGFASAILPLLVIFITVAGVCVVGGQNAMNAYVGSNIYPGAFRVTGLGWALGVTRLAGVLASSLFASYVVGLNLAPARTFSIFGAPELLASAAFFWIGARKGRLLS